MHDTKVNEVFFRNGTTSWIWSAEGGHLKPTIPSPSHYRVRRFRRTFDVASLTDAVLEIAVSADSQYALYLNGVRVGRGPSKGDVGHHFYHTHDLTALLRAGTNTLAALVMDYSPVRCFPPEMGAPGSIISYTGGFILDGAVRNKNGEEVVDVRTGPPWKVQEDQAFTFHAEGCEHGGFVGYFERFYPEREPKGWLNPDFDDSSWAAATVLYPGLLAEDYRDATAPYGLMESIVPPLKEEDPIGFQNIFLPGGDPAPAEWQAWLKGDRSITVPPNTQVAFILDADSLQTGFPMLSYQNGAQSCIQLQYAEGLRLPWSDPSAVLLGRPVDLSGVANSHTDETKAWTMDPRGTLSGWFDEVYPAGRIAALTLSDNPQTDGVEAVPPAESGGGLGSTPTRALVDDLQTAGRTESERYEPFHWRTFRFVKLSVQTQDEALILKPLRYRFAAYPFSPEAYRFHCSDKNLERWADISWDTFRLCCHETFEDCPYYEQMQYSGDSQITSLIALSVGADPRLSRQALCHFAWSLRADGITACRYPSPLPIVIPSWSLHYIFMASDYYLYTADRETLGDILPAIRNILDWFKRHTDSDGLPSQLPHWNIVDWSPRWDRGQPPGWDKGPTCIISAQYVLALRQVAAIEKALGRAEQADRYLAEAAQIAEKMNDRFWNEARGLYEDCPGGPDASQYGQAWALLAGLADADRQPRVIEAMLENKSLDPASFFGLYFIVRALEQCNAYDRMLEPLGRWNEMAEAGLSTWAEDTTYWRSLCHAWSAFPLLEMVTGVLGIRPEEPGYATICVKPNVLHLDHAEGSIHTPLGPLSVKWTLANGKFQLTIDAPAAAQLHVILPNGDEERCAGGHYQGNCTI